MLSKQQPTQQPTLHLTARGYKYWAENKHRRGDNRVRPLISYQGQNNRRQALSKLKDNT